MKRSIFLGALLGACLAPGLALAWACPEQVTTTAELTCLPGTVWDGAKGNCVAAPTS